VVLELNRQANRGRARKIGLKGAVHVTSGEITHQIASRTKPDRSHDADGALHTCELLETTPARPHAQIHVASIHMMRVCDEALLKRSDVVYSPP
jgi:hypothetical protein